MGGHVVKVLGGGDLGGKLAEEIDAVGLDELDQPVELVGDNKGVDGITEQQQLRPLQLGAQRGKIRLIAFDLLAHRQKSEGVLRVQGLKIQGGMDGGGVLALGAGVQNENIHGGSSKERRRHRFHATGTAVFYAMTA